MMNSEPTPRYEFAPAIPQMGFFGVMIKGTTGPGSGWVFFHRSYKPFKKRGRDKRVLIQQQYVPGTHFQRLPDADVYPPRKAQVGSRLNYADVRIDIFY